MNKEELDQEVRPCLRVLEMYVRRLNSLIANGTGALTKLTDGSNTSVLNECVMLNDDYKEFMGPTLRPMINKMHKAFWKNAKFNVEQSRKEQEAALMSRMPKAIKPRKKKPTKEVESVWESVPSV